LLALLETAPLTDFLLERYLTRIREVFLFAVAQGRDLPLQALPFTVALARQCFVNEYIFSFSEAEAQSAQALRIALRDGLEKGGAIREETLVAAACYLPLQELADANKLAARSWSAPVQALIEMAVLDPLRERQLRADIAALTPIAPGHSEAVRGHYEENPYPRWIKPAPLVAETGLGPAIRRAFPQATLRALPEHGAIDILIAGCGTGQQAVEMAMRFPKARITAFDLSLASLAYGRRQAEAAGLFGLQFYQGDALALGSMTQTFDLISCTGVLVLMEDPFAVLQLLIERLRPGGILQLALYSKIARQPLAAAQAQAAAMGGLGNAPAVRRLREQLLAHNQNGAFDTVLKVQDFYSVSGCRDMLSAVRENQFTLPQIGDFLRESNMEFLGFQLSPAILEDYRRRNPKDPAAVNLRAWHRYEKLNPATFLCMYQFLLQRRA
jgi:ubiquinone/menaquinone biosynthesis C-methylase UbiE